MKKILFTLLIFHLTIFAHAKTLNEHLAAAWNDSYQSLACSDNIYDLFHEIEYSETHFNTAYVIHIFHKHIPYAPIFAHQQRTIVEEKTYQPTRWTFHAVLLIDGIILDLDYTNSPRPTPLHAYMTSMWMEEDLLGDYRFQFKRAELYLGSDLNGYMKDQPELTFNELNKALMARAYAF